MGAPIGNCNAGKGVTCSPGGTGGKSGSTNNAIWKSLRGLSEKKVGAEESRQRREVKELQKKMWADRKMPEFGKRKKS